MAKVPGQRASQLTLRMHEAVHLAAAGKTHRQIAEQLGISQPAVTKLLQRANEVLYREIRTTLNSWKVGQTQSAMWVFREAAEAWEKSKKPRQRVVRVTKKKTIVDKDGKAVELDEPVEQRTEVLQSNGDVNYLVMADRAMATVRRIWGLDAPTKVQATREPTIEEQATDAELLARMQEELDEMNRRAQPVPMLSEGDDE